MFGFKETEVEADILKWINRTPNMNDIAQGLTGHNSPQAVNHLLGKDKDRVFILSRYIAFEISKRCAATFIIHASITPMVDTNPSFDGWIFQMDFFMQLRLANESKQPLTVYFDGGEELWQVPRRVEFKDPKNLFGKKYKKGADEYENKYNIKEQDWLIPTRWNQGCYDVVQLLDKSIRIVQVTRAKSHYLNLTYVHKLIKALVNIRGITIEKIDFVVVVPRQDVLQFRVSESKIVGELKQNWGWEPKHIRVRGLIRTHNN